MKSAKIWAGAAVAAAAMVWGYAAIEGANPDAASAADTKTQRAMNMAGDMTGVKMPTKVDNFRLSDANLNSQELYRLKDAAAVVLITQSNGCPVVRNSATAYRALHEKYAAKGVEFFMLNSAMQDSREDIVAEAKEFNIDIPILVDRNQLVGEQLGVTRTAEVIIINPKTWQIAYRGPVDDRVTYERQKAKAEQTWADDALDAMLSNRSIKVAYQPTEGCIVNFPGREDQGAIAKISYAKDIAPIMKEKCISCHQPGGIGPMEFTTYEKIRGMAPMIRETIRTQRMPPYHADPSVGHFQDDKRLSAKQIQTLVHWVEAGAPRGKGTDPLAAVKFQAPEWPLGTPDLVLDIPAFTIPASGVVDYQTPYVANPLTEGRWIRATTVKVEQRQGVHHVLSNYVPPSTGNRADFASAGIGGGVSVGGYAVGTESFVSPKDSGTYLPAGGGVRLQNHYTPFGKEVVDHSQIGVYFHKKQPKQMMRSAVIADIGISIPAGEGRHRETAYATFPQEAILFGILPHAHYRGDGAQISAVYPDGREELLVSVPHYDFNWQREYTFAKPLRIPAGTKLVARYTYDNSKRNPANPDPNKVITWGEQSWQEMLYTAIRYQWIDETTDNQKPEYTAALSASLQFGMLDDNVNGKIELAEMSGRLGSAMRPMFAALDANKDGGIDDKEMAAASALGGGLGGRGGARAGGGRGGAPAAGAPARGGAPAAAAPGRAGAPRG